MLTSERHQAILQILNEHGTVTVNELKDILDTSESTIRRDLVTLDNERKLNKVFGGATAIRQKINEDIHSVTVKAKQNVLEKIEIAKYSAKTINDYDCVYIDAGTSTSFLIDFIENKTAIYVTNGIVHAKKLIQKGLKAYVIGGQLKLSTEAIVGADSLDNLKKYNFTKCFLGTNGIDKNAGFTTIDIEEALIKTEALKRSYITFVLADHTKFSQVFPITFGELKQACIITDKLTDKKFSAYTVVKEVMI